MCNVLCFTGSLLDRCDSGDIVRETRMVVNFGEVVLSGAALSAHDGKTSEQWAKLFLQDRYDGEVDGR